MKRLKIKEETPQPNRVSKIQKPLKKSKEKPQTKKETPQLNRVFKNTEAPKNFCGNVSKKIFFMNY